MPSQNKNNRYFSDHYLYTGHSSTETTIQLTSYNKQVLETKHISVDTKSFKALLKADCMNWLHVCGLRDAKTISRLVDEFGVQNLDVRDILTPNHLVKIDYNNDYIFVIMNSCSYNSKHKIFSEHIGIIVLENVVITFTEDRDVVFKNVEDALEEDTMKIREQKGGMLLAFLLNSVFSEMIRTALRVENILEKMEDTLLNTHYNPQNIGSRIQHCRHAYLILRKNTQPLKRDFFKLLQPDEKIIDKALIPVFNELSDQLEYIIQTSESSKDILLSLVGLYASNNDLQLNRVMARLTIVSTLFIPVTFLVGLWGMNFVLIPELNWKYGYLFAWIVILLTALGTWLFMKKKKWF